MTVRKLPNPRQVAGIYSGLYIYYHAPDAVLESVMGGPRKDIVGAAHLLDVSQSLELGRVDDGDTQRIELDVAVNAVVEYLQEPLGGDNCLLQVILDRWYGNSDIIM